MHQLTMTDKRQALAEARRNQLRALMRAALVGPLSIVFPGVTDPAQWILTMEGVRKCSETLQRRGVPCADKVSCGCVIDSPAAAIMAGEIIAGGADFLLIDGSSLARHAGGVAQDSPLDSPAVLRLAEMAFRAADEHHTPVYFGSFGEETAALPAFLRLGARIFCTEASLIREAKAVLTESSTE